MIPAEASILSVATLFAAAWFLTYLIHSTILLGVVRLAARLLKPALAMEETLWKAAMVGAVATALWQAAGFGVTPFGHRLEPAGRVGMISAPPVVEPVAQRDEPVLRRDEPAPQRDEPAVAAMPIPALHDAESGPYSDLENDRTAGAATTLTPATVTWAVVEEPIPAGAGTPVFPAGLLARARDFAAGLPWPALLLAGWVLGAGLGLARLLAARFRLRRLLRGRQEIVGGHLIGMLDRLRSAAGIRRPIRLTLSPRLAGPVALGRGEICLPRRVLSDLSPGQQQSVLAHELAHLERGDPAWLWVTAVLEAVFFFQPLNRIARRQLRDLAEFRCDDWAVRHAGGNLILARCLAEVAGWVKASPALASGMAQTSSPLVRRIERLLADRDLFREPGRHWRWLAGLVLVGVVASVGPGVTTGSYLRPDNAPWSPGASPWPDFPFVLAPPGWTTTPLGSSTWGSAPILEGGGQLGEVYGCPTGFPTGQAVNPAFGCPSSEEDERFARVVPLPRVHGHPAGPEGRSLPPSPRQAVRLHPRPHPGSERLVEARRIYEIQAQRAQESATRRRDARLDRAAQARARVEKEMRLWEARTGAVRNHLRRLTAQPASRVPEAADPAAPVAPVPVAPAADAPKVPFALVNGGVRIPSERLAAFVSDLKGHLDGPIAIDLGDLAAAFEFDAQDGTVDFQFQLHRLAEAERMIELKGGISTEQLARLKKAVEDNRVFLLEQAEALDATDLERMSEALKKIDLTIETGP